MVQALNFHPVVENILDSEHTMFQRSDNIHVMFSVDGGLNADIASCSLNTVGLVFTCLRSSTVADRYLFQVNK